MNSRPRSLIVLRYCNCVKFKLLVGGYLFAQSLERLVRWIFVPQRWNSLRLEGAVLQSRGILSWHALGLYRLITWTFQQLKNHADLKIKYKYKRWPYVQYHLGTKTLKKQFFKYF